VDEHAGRCRRSSSAASGSIEMAWCSVRTSPSSTILRSLMFVQLGVKVLAKGAKVLTFQKRVFSTILDEKIPFQRF
jgi:hypothetical protein